MFPHSNIWQIFADTSGMCSVQYKGLGAGGVEDRATHSREVGSVGEEKQVNRYHHGDERLVEY